MAFSTLMIIIAAMLITGGLLGFFLRPSVNWCVNTARRLYFRPKLLSEHKVDLSAVTVNNNANPTESSGREVNSREVNSREVNSDEVRQ